MKSFLLKAIESGVTIMIQPEGDNVNIGMHRDGHTGKFTMDYEHFLYMPSDIEVELIDQLKIHFPNEQTSDIIPRGDSTPDGQPKQSNNG